MAKIGVPFFDFSAVLDKLQAIADNVHPTASGTSITPTGMHIVTEDDVQGAISELDSAVDSVNASLTNLARIEVVTYSESTEIASGATATVNIPVPTIAGYTPLGVVGISKGGAGNGYVALCGYFRKASLTEFEVSFVNTYSSSRTLTQIILRILYVRSELI